MSAIDLHAHSTKSDGTLTPAGLVELARKRGIRVLSLTDHDTVSGVDEAMAAAARCGLELVPGLEISVAYQPGTMHILGYFLDHRSRKLAKTLAGVQRARGERNPELVRKLNSLGIDITMEEIEAESRGGQIGRPHFARVLKKKGYVKNFDEAFDQYLGKGKPAYVAKRRLSPAEGIRLIREAGGLAVLAHPKQLRLKTKRELEEILDELVRSGLGGVEAYSSCHSGEEAALYREAGERLGLVITCGSDFHGGAKPDVELGDVGPGAKIAYNIVARMKQRLK